MKQGIDFQNQAKLKGIIQWHSHNCTFCEYPVGYHFSGEDVYYDNGCDCTCGQNLNERSWEDVAERYNMQTNADVIKRMNDFWGFTN